MMQQYLQLALENAIKGRGYCAPNPAVGAVVVREQQVIATGYHKGPGLAHAEVVALDAAGAAASGATIYVTLEPCCHFGRTPPCTDKIIAAGIKKVVYGFQDPNPVVAGSGHEQLKQAGIEVEFLTTAEISKFYQSYQYWTEHKRAVITAKLAISLDGKIAAAGRKAVAITGAACNAYTHQRRLKSDAIITTAQTLLDDDPQLNARMDSKTIQKNLYVLDRSLRIKPELQIFKTTKSITVLHANDVSLEKIQELERHNVKCVALGSDEQQQFAWSEIAAFLGEQGVHDAWVEAGGKCMQGILTQSAAQEVIFYVAPKILGANAYSAFDDSFELTNYNLVSTEKFNDDAVLIYGKR